MLAVRRTALQLDIHISVSEMSGPSKNIRGHDS